MIIYSHSVIKYILAGKLSLITHSNIVSTIIINPILKVKKCNVNGITNLIITNNTGMKLKNICIKCHKKILIDQLDINQVKIVGYCNNYNKCIIIKYKIKNMSVYNTMYLTVN